MSCIGVLVGFWESAALRVRGFEVALRGNIKFWAIGFWFNGCFRVLGSEGVYERRCVVAIEVVSELVNQRER